ncbi:hypothetical protein EDB83DRAFT_2407028, partial [Lactarius deliciosus]
MIPGRRLSSRCPWREEAVHSSRTYVPSYVHKARLLYVPRTGHLACLRSSSLRVARRVEPRLEGLCFLHEHKIAHCAYGDPNGVMMDIGRSSSVGFDHTRLPVGYYRVNLSRVQELPREADPRSVSFCRDVRGCGAMFQTPVEEV